MFDKLVESKEVSKVNGPRQNLLAASSAVVIATLGAMLIFSLFNQTLAMGEEIGDLTRMVTPNVESEIDRSPEPESDRSEPERSRSKDAIATRIKAVARIDSPTNKAPDKVSSEPSRFKTVPPGPFRIDKLETDPYKGTSGSMGQGGNTGLETPGDGAPTPPIKAEKQNTVKLPPALPKVEATKYVGVVNGRAIELPKPNYPQAARTMGIKGAVKVEVLIDEKGKVISANAIDGNGLLIRESVLAAKRSIFTPTTVGGNRIRVRGIIIYNFQ